MKYKVGQIIKLYRIAQPCKVVKVLNRGSFKGYWAVDLDVDFTNTPFVEIKESDIDDEATDRILRGDYD